MMSSRAQIFAAVLGVVAVLGVSSASAASLGGIAAGRLSAHTVSGVTAAPTVIAWENFDGSNNGNIAGTTTDGGGLTWAAPTCTWRRQSNMADSSGGNTCVLFVTAPTPYHSVQATLTRSSSAWDAGLIFNSNAAISRFLSIEWVNPNELQIWKYNSGWASLATYTDASLTATSIDLRVDFLAPIFPATTSEMRVFVNGSYAFSHTLSAGDQALYKVATQRRFGLITYYDGNTRFDDFHIDS